MTTTSEVSTFRLYLLRAMYVFVAVGLEITRAYYRLKQDLAREHRPNGRQYVDGKSAFVQSVMEQARREVGHTRTEHATYDS